MGAVLALVEPEQPSPQEPVSPRDRLTWLEKRGHLNPEQVAAGNHLLTHRERSKRVPYAASGGSGAGGDLNPFEAKAIARRKYEQAVDHVGELGAVILHAIVFENMKIEDAARVADIHPKAVLPCLRIVLDVLRTHYRMP